RGPADPGGVSPRPGHGGDAPRSHGDPEHSAGAGGRAEGGEDTHPLRLPADLRLRLRRQLPVQS
ncbi:unnamed protein product, partial [Heterosigma akashiwo]